MMSCVANAGGPARRLTLTRWHAARRVDGSLLAGIWSAVHFVRMPEVLLLVIDDEPQVRRVIRNALSETSTRLLELFSQVWNRAHGDAQQNLRVHVANLRRKLERDPVRPELIITEPGAGYRFKGA